MNLWSDPQSATSFVKKTTGSPFHLVTPSPWPVVCGMNALLLAAGLVIWFHLSSNVLLVLALFNLIFTSFLWWRDVRREGSLQGSHSAKVEQGLKYGMILFILSEIMFFFSFFWAFFHSSLSPTASAGMVWPPAGVEALPALGDPLLNTIILLASGVSVTWAHFAVLAGKHNMALLGLLTTVILGIYFTMNQLVEYLDSSFAMADGIYGSVFFVATGFHGLHVIIGTIFLSCSLARVAKYDFSQTHHFGFEAAAWYWHFVDVVWLFLFTFIYWWGS